jgi:hypothetical protein
MTIQQLKLMSLALRPPPTSPSPSPPPFATLPLPQRPHRQIDRKAQNRASPNLGTKTSAKWSPPRPSPPRASQPTTSEGLPDEHPLLQTCKQPLTKHSNTSVPTPFPPPSLQHALRCPWISIRSRGDVRDASVLTSMVISQKNAFILAETPPSHDKWEAYRAPRRLQPQPDIIVDASSG